ncbi:MAG: hypothetical protein JNN01_21880 [Opitutaceae bacterium]|nr:hypothetical protein [Opitutaceae bacterium]
MPSIPIASAFVMRPFFPSSRLLCLLALGIIRLRAGGPVDDFDFLVTTVEENYAGFSDKVTAANRPAYDTLIATTRSQLESMTTSEAALPLIQAWAGFFHDRHLSVYLPTPPSPPAGTSPATAPSPAPAGPSPRDMAAAGPRRYITEPDWKEQWSRQPGTDPLEGIWQSDDGVYRVGVRREQDKWVAVLLATTTEWWSPGQIKFEAERAEGSYRAAFRLRNHSERQIRLHLAAGNRLFHSPDLSGIWRRVFPEPEKPLPDHFGDRMVPASGFFLRRLSDATLWLRLPHFEPEGRDLIAQLFRDHAEALTSTPNLVIDLRRNQGGWDSTYREVIRLLYTRPIYTVGIELLSTPLNRTKWLEHAEDPAVGDLRNEMLRIAALMEAKPRGFIQPHDRPFSILTFPEVKPFPRRVGILITGAASSGEQFVLSARQSRKVTLFGGNTSGTLDYANLHTVSTPGKRFQLSYPTSRSLRLPDEPVDAVGGIAPDVAIAADELDPVGVVQAWLERQVD